MLPHLLTAGAIAAWSWCECLKVAGMVGRSPPFIHTLERFEGEFYLFIFFICEKVRRWVRFPSAVCSSSSSLQRKKSTNEKCWKKSHVHEQITMTRGSDSFRTLEGLTSAHRLGSLIDPLVGIYFFGSHFDVSAPVAYCRQTFFFHARCFLFGHFDVQWSRE